MRKDENEKWRGLKKCNFTDYKYKGTGWSIKLVYTAKKMFIISNKKYVYFRLFLGVRYILMNISNWWLKLIKIK